MSPKKSSNKPVFSPSEDISLADLQQSEVMLKASLATVMSPQEAQETWAQILLINELEGFDIHIEEL